MHDTDPGLELWGLDVAVVVKERDDMSMMPVMKRWSVHGCWMKNKLKAIPGWWTRGRWGNGLPIRALFLWIVVR
jgi:hypothetical protein